MAPDDAQPAEREAEAPESASGEQPTGEENGSAEAVEQDLDALIADLRRERDEYLALAQRARADFENFRKRAAGELAAAERRAKGDLAGSLLGAIDNLERALLAAGVDPSAPQGAEGESADASREKDGDGLAQGVALVYRELTSALAAAGIEPFDPLGERFDPEIAEALSTRPATEDEEAGVVVETLQRGYRIGESLIRPARVVVSG